MEVGKIGFFSRIKKSIFKFDEYEKFIMEKPGKAFAYFLKLLLIFAFLITISMGYSLNKQVKEIKNTLENVFPNFRIAENTLEIDDKDEFEHYFEDLNFQIIMKENEENYTENDYENSLILLKNKMVIKYSGFTEEIGYNSINNVSNRDVIEFFGSQEWKIIFCNVCVVMFAVNYILYFILIMLDIFTLSIIGLILNNIIGIHLRYVDIFKLSVYSMTLPIILFVTYMVANILFGTTIKYFQIAYNAISYIYLITVLLIIKSDIIKNTQELQKIIEEQKKVKEELQREKEEEKEEEKEKQKEKEKNKAPDNPQTENG